MTKPKPKVPVVQQMAHAQDEAMQGGELERAAVRDDRAAVKAAADAHAETMRDTERGYRVKHVGPSRVPYYETLEGSYGNFDEQTVREHVASVRLLANNLIG